MFTAGIDGDAGLAQMDKASKPSPPAKASCTLADGKTIAVITSSPRAKGPQDFWRTGTVRRSVARRSQ